MKIQVFDLPVIGEDDGLLKVEMCGVCGSDPRIFEWTDPERFPLIMGHEVLGRIEEIGSQASARWGIEKGDRVVVEHLFGCGHCRMCLIGEYRFCFEQLGYGGPIPSSVPPHLWGAYGEYMYLAPNSRIHRIARDVPAEAAAMTCANIGNGIRWVRTKGGVSVGDTVVVIGPGGQGLAAVLAAREAGAAIIVVIGLMGDNHRFQLAGEFGATHFINIETEDPVQSVRKLTGGALADVVMDLTGATSSAPLSLELVRPMGTIVLGSNTGEASVPLVSSKIAAKEIRYQGVNSHDTSAVRAAIKLVESRRYPIQKMVTHYFELAEVETAVRAAGGEIRLDGFIKGVIVPNP
ncbi:MAG: alcohol dehydrogenase catalytic domain-containing protein [Candidatus Poribacteria bacterium]|nr:alcohol dehydrogenase catalytic domain-containing protein [Candidatus Poribacteria bacterium]MDE0504533.1 alcohol dehydrogenase catalytic domain-containing protein [Candidatus Poribacteria bacterium]